MVPIVLITLAYVLGVIGGLYNICIAPFCLIICLIFIKKEKNLKIIGIVFFISGILLTSLRLSFYDERYVAGNINMDVRIVSDVVEKEKVNSYIVKKNNNDKFIIYVDKDVELEYGMSIKLNGNLELPDVSRNRRRI